ncbi:MAG: phosphate ABC transporter substrate-binding protein [Actinobacteria bacterium]|nr:MAG: phosphate ABC transporter substrate-binding protein [Actinomycetota bacterium]
MRATRATLVAFVLLATLVPLLSGCSRGTSAQDKIIVTGSTTIQPIAEVAKEDYERRNPDQVVLVSGVGSSAGIENVSSGTSDIGTSSRELKDEELDLGLVDTPIAYDAIAVIVNPSNPVTSLSKSQVKAIFQGAITNWSEVGGPDMEIGLVNRDEASGTREAFAKIVLDKERFDPTAVILPGTGQVRSVVAQEPRAIGYISLGFVTDDVHAVAIDGVEPSEATVVSGTYPVQRVLHMFTKGAPTGLAKRYLDFVLSPDVQESVVRDAGFIPITAKGSNGG